MLGNRKLVLDTFCEVYDLLEPWMDHDFWDFSTHEIVPGAVYLVSRKEVLKNLAKVRAIADSGQALLVFSNPAEGSETLAGQCADARIQDLAHNKKILIIGGGDMDPRWPCLQYDSFLPKILDYEENLHECSRITEIYNKTHKPYKFLFLNGRSRGHRQYLINRFSNSQLLDQSIWTNLDVKNGPINYLDPGYEVDQYSKNVNQSVNDQFVKYKLFDDKWGEIYLKAEPYIDSYFSVVTETVFNYPYSFRTEKIWKPIAIGHPWIAVANQGYYRDLHNLGFQTFGHVIDESFDSIENNQDRLERIAQVIEDLCRQDLASFLKECYNVCKYNQQHLAEMRQQVRQEFPNRFEQFIQQHL